MGVPTRHSRCCLNLRVSIEFNHAGQRRFLLGEFLSELVIGACFPAPEADFPRFPMGSAEDDAERLGGLAGMVLPSQTAAARSGGSEAAQWPDFGAPSTRGGGGRDR